MRRRSLLDLALSQAAPFLGSFLVTFGSAAALGPSGRGLLAFITSTCTVAGGVLFASLHVGTTSEQTAGRAGLRKGSHWVVRIVGTGVLVGFLVSALVPADLAIGPLTRPLCFVITLGTGLVAVNLYVLRSIQGLGEDRVFRNAWAIQSLTYLALGLPAAVVTRRPTLVVAAWLVGLVLATSYALRTYVTLVRSGPTEPVSSRDLLRPSLLAHIGTIGLQLLYRADVVVLGLVAAAHEVGIYSIAIAVAGLIWIVAEAFSLAAFSRSHTDTALALRTRDLRLIKVNALLSLVAGLGIAALSLGLLGRVLPEFAQAVPLTLVLLPGVIAQGPARVAFSSLLRRRDARPATWIGLGSAALSVAYVPAAMTFQATGVAVASTVIYVVQAVAVLWVWATISRRERLIESDLASPEGRDNVVA